MPRLSISCFCNVSLSVHINFDFNLLIQNALARKGIGFIFDILGVRIYSMHIARKQLAITINSLVICFITQCQQDIELQFCEVLVFKYVDIAQLPNTKQAAEIQHVCCSVLTNKDYYAVFKAIKEDFENIYLQREKDVFLHKTQSRSIGSNHEQWSWFQY